VKLTVNLIERMNLAELHEKLIAAARRKAPDERVPYAFEQRIMAQLAARAGAEHWVFWARGLWRAAASCVAVAVVFGAVSLFLPVTSDNGNDLSQDFENTLLASADLPDNSSTP
jgi:anti-sigma-K factor RskA